MFNGSGVPDRPEGKVLEWHFTAVPVDVNHGFRWSVQGWGGAGAEPSPSTAGPWVPSPALAKAEKNVSVCQNGKF